MNGEISELTLTCSSIPKMRAFNFGLTKSVVNYCTSYQRGEEDISTNIHPPSESQESCKAHNATYQQLPQGNTTTTANTTPLC